jgi:hypothetical protein
MSLPINLNEYLVHVLLVSGSRTPPSQVICELLAELQAPLASGLVGKSNTPLSHQQFDISEAE